MVGAQCGEVECGEEGREMIHALNFCRQMSEQFRRVLPDAHPDSASILARYIVLAANSQKFILPKGGRPLDDPELRALDTSEPLRIPFQIIALEYEHDKNKPLHDNQVMSSKRIAFAIDGENYVDLFAACWYDEARMWGPSLPIRIPKTDYLIRDQEGLRVRIYPDMRSLAPVSDFTDECCALFSFL